MTVALTSNFFANARGVTLKDSASVTWALNANTNELTATAAGGSGLTSVGLSDNSGTPIYTVGNSPLVANGTLTLTLNTQAQKTFFAGPTSGANAQPAFRVLAVADVPTLNQNTTGTAAGLSVTLLATSGGTGQSVYAVGDLLYADTTTTLAKRADVAAGSYLRSGGVNTAPVWSTVTIPNAAVLGDLWYGSAASAVSALAGSTSATKQFLTQTGNGSISAAPSWGTIAAGDLPANGANPSASLGLAAVNGSATTWMRSDGAPALSQSIVPTWTGAHTFSALLTANLGITVAGATLKVAVGTATLAPITMQSGTNLTTAAVGVLEYDGTCFYNTPAASSRAVNSTEYVCVMNGTKTLTSQTAAQAIFNSTANGAVTLPIGTYIFECQFQLTAMSTVTGGFGFALGGAATFTQGWSSLAVNAAAVTASNAQMTYDTAANTAIGTASTAGVAHAMIKGIIRVTVAGTVIPQVSLITAAAAVVAINSYFKCYPVGNGTATTVGNWS